MSVVAEPVTSHRERKKRATREAIHDAACELVEANGLQGTTIEAISELAGVAPRTFWSYFSSKEDAVLDTDPETPERLRQALLERPAGEDPLTSLRRVLEEHIVERADSDRSHRRQRLIHAEPSLMAAVAAAYDEFGRAMASAVAERIGVDMQTDFLPGVLVMTAIGCCRVAQIRWSGDEDGRPLPVLIGEAFDKLAEGLTPFVLEHRGEQDQAGALHQEGTRQ